MDDVLGILKLLLILLWIIALPFVLLIAAPAILFWPQRNSSGTYIGTVLRRYWMVICLSASVGGDAVEVDADGP